jgi:hypothetical protein
LTSRHDDPIDVYRCSEERVCISHDGADVEVVFPVLDGDVEAVASCVEIGNDCVDRPVPVFVEHVATIAILE